MKKLLSSLLSVALLMSFMATTLAADTRQSLVELVPAATQEEGMEESSAGIYLDNKDGDDANNGLTVDTAVKTFAKAKELLPENGTIWLKGTYMVTADETWSLADKGENAMVKRYRYGKDKFGAQTLIYVNMIALSKGVELTLENIVIDGAKDLWEAGQFHNNAIVVGLDGGKLTLNSGAVLQNNNGEYMGAGVSGWNGFELVMNDGAIIRDNETYNHEYGGGVFISGGKFVMNGGSISGNRANRGGGVAIVAGEFVMNGGVIEKNSTYQIGPQPGYGGGLYLSSYEEFSGAPAFTVQGDTTFTMNGGEIRSNHAQSVGGGILTFPQHEKKVAVNIFNGKITENLTEDSGGGICMYFRDSVLNMTGGEISDNEAKKYGGGIYQYNTVYSTINGGSVTGNTAQYGGGAHIDFGSQLMLCKGAISNNTSTSNGGGVNIVGNSLFEMNGGKVNENTAKMFGGGVNVGFDSGRFHMIAGEVQGNQALANGSSAGINVGNLFELGGTAKIDPDNDVFLLSANGKHIDMISPYTGTTGAEPIQITSNRADVEGEQIGTQLVLYDDAAGGAAAAAKADADGIFVPSKYMQDGLMIGESAYEEDWMTYIHGVKISYEWTGENRPVDVAPPHPHFVRVNTVYTAKEQKPTQEDYRFLGWFTDEACTQKFVGGTEIAEDMPLYGKWEKVTSPTPPKPDRPIRPERPDPPADLNTKDHFSYIIGYPDGTIRPQGTMTRGEAATIFFRLLTDKARDKYWCQTNNYTDVPADLWCNNAISTLSNMGIIDGLSDGSFQPWGTITRAQFAKMAVGFFETADEEYQGYFNDVAQDVWYTSYVEAAARVGLIAGFGDGSFRPDEKITRAQACVIVNRALDRHPDADHLLPVHTMITWPDSKPGEWSYADMQEATNSHDYRMESKYEDGEKIKQEHWTGKLPQRDWAAFEHAWSDAHSAAGGEVLSNH